MPALDNPRHERFAQALMQGKSADAAYQEAGFKPNRGNATTLKAKQSIQDRVAELQSRVVKNVVLSKEWVIERLIENADRAMQAVEVKDHKGIGTGEYKYDGAVANKALELLGKEVGMFIDRKEVGAPGEFDSLNLEEKRERAASLTRQLGLDRISQRTQVEGNA